MICNSFFRKKKVLEFNPGLIGFSVLEITYDQGLELAKAIEDLNIPVIFGEFTLLLP